MSVQEKMIPGRALLKLLRQDYKVITNTAPPKVSEQKPQILVEDNRQVKIPACYYVATSVDGLISDASGGVDWLRPFFEIDYGFHGFLNSIDTVLMGRRTYERLLNSTKTNPYEGKRFVVLSHLRSNGPHADLFWSGPLRGLMVRLEAMGSKSIWIVGGGSVAGTFLESGLLDEVQQFVMPLVLGSGTPLFGPVREMIPLHLKTSRSFSNGVLQLHYITDEGRSEVAVVEAAVGVVQSNGGVTAPGSEVPREVEAVCPPQTQSRPRATNGRKVRSQQTAAAS